MTNRELEALERQKAYHYECIRALNTRINALAPISKSPPEVLSANFLQNAGRGHPQAVGRWIYVTHVCVRLRYNAPRSGAICTSRTCPKY